MVYLFILGLILNSDFVRANPLETFKEVLEKRVTTINQSSDELAVTASYDRVRKWLPRSPQVSYWSNDSHTWKAWSVNTSVPIPLKSWYRDDVEAAQKNFQQASANSNKQEIFKKTLGVFLDCAIPSELEKLMRLALEDQTSVAQVLNTLYTYGKVPQSDRVSSQLTQRQIEAQVNMYDAQAKAACERWEAWAGIPHSTEDPNTVPSDLEDEFLKKIGLTSDHYRDQTNKKLLLVTLSKEKLWSKYIPDLDFTWTRNNYFNLIASGGPPRKFTTSWSVGVTLPFAFPFYEHTDFKRERAELGISRMQAELEKTEADKNWEEARNDWGRITNRLEQMWTNDLAVADVLVESTLAGYRNGKSGFAELALARRTRLDLKIEEIQLKAERLVSKTVCLSECQKME